MSLLLIILVLILLFGGGGYYGYRRNPGWGPLPGGLIGVLFILLVVWLIFGGGFAHAAEAPAASTTVAVTTPAAVTFPIGDWITLFLSWARDIAVAVIVALVGTYAPAPIRMLLTNNVITKGVDYGFAIIAGAEKGKTLTVPQTNELLARAEEYIVARAPSIAKGAGNDLKAMILSRVAAAGSAPPEGDLNKLDVIHPSPVAR